MSARPPRVYTQGVNTYVIGSDDIRVALSVLGISPETHRWSSTEYGMFARRQRAWRQCSDYMTPKDAKPGVCFFGPIRANETEAQS